MSTYTATYPKGTHLATGTLDDIQIMLPAGRCLAWGPDDNDPWDGAVWESREGGQVTVKRIDDEEKAKEDSGMSLQDINESLEYLPSEEDQEAYAQVLEQTEIIGDPNFIMYKLPTGDCIVLSFFECQGANTIQHYTERGLEIANRVVITRTGWYYA